MPADGDPTKLNDDAALTVLLFGNDNVFYYHGNWENAIQNNEVQATSYEVKTGIGNIIREKQKRLGKKRNELMLLIKPLETASYSNLINMIDEAMINDVKKYAIVDAMKQEREFIPGRKD
jgi:hypothetical protein